jgi:diaminopimelate epimerase
MARLRFTKMEGLGNDFMVVDAVRQHFAPAPERVRRLADRHHGVGFDQLLLVEAGRDGADFRYRIFNADGSEVHQCGNGARCFARFVREQGLSEARRLVVETGSGRLTLELHDDDSVSVDLGVPRFEPDAVPFVAEADQPLHVLEIDGLPVQVAVLSLGNPHAVQFVDDLDAAPVGEQGPRVERHPRFPAGVNAGYARVVDATHLALRVWERGVGETRACGSGACAAMVAGRRLGWLAGEVTVSLAGGDLRVCWEGEGQSVVMRGPAATVFEGSIDLESS